MLPTKIIHQLLDRLIHSFFEGVLAYFFYLCWNRDQFVPPIASMTTEPRFRWSLRGEVDYTSRQRKIGGEYEHIGEVLREVGISNPYDARGASAACNARIVRPLHVGSWDEL